MRLTDFEPGRRLFERDELLFFQRPSGLNMKLQSIIADTEYKGYPGLSPAESGEPLDLDNRWPCAMLQACSQTSVTRQLDTPSSVEAGGTTGWVGRCRDMVEVRLWQRKPSW